jgi:hypothetical protein
MHIDSYQFGRIVIDGVAYNSDCLIVSGSVKANWWRRQGHSLSIKDLQVVIEAKPEVLVVGCGSSGMMVVPQETREVLKQQGIQVEVYNTSEAAQRFNELSQAGTNVALALHLTC